MESKEKPTWMFWVNKERNPFTGYYYKFKLFKVYWAYRKSIQEELDKTPMQRVPFGQGHFTKRLNQDGTEYRQTS